MARTFDIITTCMGRLEHLKQSLPQMLNQGAANVIVVDYCCPDGAGNFVREHFPQASVVNVDEQAYFSNWRARNAGASKASADTLLFCDADTILADGAVKWLAERLPNNAIGHFERRTMRKLNTAKFNLADNQLAGFLAVPRAAFARVGGYDEVLEGYAAGGDTDLTYRLGIIGLKMQALDPSAMIDSVIEHDDADRGRHHSSEMSESFCAGLIYRSAKRYLLAIRNRAELDLGLRKRLYRSAQEAARTIDPNSGAAFIDVPLEQSPILMAPLVGYEAGVQNISLRVELSFAKPLPPKD